MGLTVYPREVQRGWEFEAKDLESDVILDLRVQREASTAPTTAALCGGSSRLQAVDVREDFPL